ncbi:DUF305 domain-containing protein [Microbacterium sp. MYb62]|uniref:DUF305 domain-containing protein n=1 Tax=Microbacterium sp. MYb62 TaxID=1848690 RepID=UPI000CFC2ACC|nr:DUF305 domain-containing protein [Microbacterium sp. MYb62]PRB09570.1 DUF305 domain-containing protein [Microbacterium sp. MYb62]
MKIRAAATAALTLTAILALSGCAAGADQDSMPGMDHGPSTEAPAPADAGVNDADVMFASMMIVHHEQAIEMSDIVLAAEGATPEVTALAAQIKEAQGPEIEQLEGWLDDWGVSPDDRDATGMDHGDGMMSADDLAALDAAEGAEASRLFLEQMIEHHEGAVDMAQAQVDDGSDPDAIDLAQSIIDAQTEEIQEMKDLLSAL